MYIPVSQETKRNREVTRTQLIAAVFGGDTGTVARTHGALDHASSLLWALLRLRLGKPQLLASLG